MTEKKKDLLIITAILALMILLFSKILFTHQIVRAPDIINEFYWYAKSQANVSLLDIFKIDIFHAPWDTIINSGNTDEGGSLTWQLLFHRSLLFALIPPPASVAWFMIIQFFIGAVGIYCYCRAIGVSRLGSIFGMVIVAFATENVSLINAGHVMKIATITIAPWAFYLLERGFQTRRVIFFLSTAFVLAFQFFNVHWQIAFYTCLSVGVYGLLRVTGIYIQERGEKHKTIVRVLGLNLVTLLFFLSTVAISLVPLANWSKGTNRGTESGANQGKGGLNREEAMSWSLPPEEMVSFVIPGFFGFSRQEAGENPGNIASYYWGRMHFTQTASYFGLLPWLLVPLPLLFRRDRYTWLAVTAVALGILFSMGKYTPFYNFLYDHFPGINRFRVPKMMMFIPVLGLGVLSALGLDLLREERVRQSEAFRRYLACILLLPLLLLTLLAVEIIGREFWIGKFFEMLSQPTRYEEGAQLIGQRWQNLVVETGIAAGLALAFAAVFGAYYRKWLPCKVLPFALMALFLLDVGRVNSKFLFLVDEPQHVKGVTTPEINFLSGMSKQYRVLPFNSDAMQYASKGLPVMYVSNPVQQRRWQEFIENFTLASAMPDLLNVKYLIYNKTQYAEEKLNLPPKYVPVFISPDENAIVLENRNVLPKAWLVPAVSQIFNSQQALTIMQNPAFDPKVLALVETPAPVQMANMEQGTPFSTQAATVSSYGNERIVVTAHATQNALLVLGEKYYKGWKATVDGTVTEIYPVNHVLRGVYLQPGDHTVTFIFDPLPFKIGKYLTLSSFALFAGMLIREWLLRRTRVDAKGVSL